MAIRNIIIEGDEILRKISRPVEKFDDRLGALIDDMFQTMEEAGGVGLAAPQVGILRRICVIDAGTGPFELVNPKIISSSGSQEVAEACLSCPGDCGITHRPMNVKVKAQDRTGRYYTVSGKSLLARALCHEIDHLDGILFKDIVIKMLDENGE